MKPIRHKFNAKKTEVGTAVFPSKKEAAYFKALVHRQEAGEILFFLRQCPFHSRSGIKYLVDFIEFHADNTVHFVDVKGIKTQTYLLKKKLIENEFPITIEEV